MLIVDDLLVDFLDSVELATPSMRASTSTWSCSSVQLTCNPSKSDACCTGMPFSFIQDAVRFISTVTFFLFFFYFFSMLKENMTTERELSSVSRITFYLVGHVAAVVQISDETTCFHLCQPALKLGHLSTVTVMFLDYK